MNAILEQQPAAVRNGATQSTEPARLVLRPGGDVNQRGRRIQELIAQIEALPDVQARELLHECIQAVLALHGDGLERMLQLMKNAGMAGKEITEALQRDKLVRGLLLIHGLHPVPLEARLREALDKVRPYMKSHGGNVELVYLENERAGLRLEGTCQSCPSSGVTLELAVRQAVEEACPDLVEFEVQGAVVRDAALNHLPADAPKWTVLEDFLAPEEGEMRPQEVNEIPVVFFKRDSNFYAYRDRCPGCGSSLHDGQFTSNRITCQCGRGFNIQRAGACSDDTGIHLEPIPLLAANGAVKISVR